MPIDFLGGEAKKEDRKKDEGIVFHKPEKEKIEKIKKDKTKLLIVLLIFVIIIVLGFGSYYLYFAEPQVVVENINIGNEPIVIPAPVIEPVVEPEPVIEPVVEPEPVIEPVILPDTELAPIRGSVVTFNNDDTLFLIEDNGELRMIDLTTVRFDNGQTITQISPDLVYLLADKWKTIRKGENVYGLVDWDPRVLKLEELAPFK
jgi:hypothetical protein